MKKKLLSLLCLIWVITLSGVAWSNEGKKIHTIMRPDRETRQRWIQNYQKAPRARIDKRLSFSTPLGGSRSLLSHLKYTPAEHNQGRCGNCWAWAGTGAMAIALDVEEGIFDRLSVQFVNSCDTTTSCCEGGWLSNLADFYTRQGYAIPWSNTNANWQDGDGNCNVSCGSIATSPRYGIVSIQEQTIETFGVGRATAIANIKNVLNQGRAVWFAFFLPTQADWDRFYNFWDEEEENVVWNPDDSCRGTWDDESGGGHAVLCVGYNDDDPDNSYWIMVNSWGITDGRPNGLFRMDMNIDYDCCYYDGYYPFNSFWWQTLDIEYGYAPVPLAPAVVTNPPTSVTSSSAQLNGTVNPNGGNTTCYFEYGKSIKYGAITGNKWLGSGTTNVPVNATLTGLAPKTGYHFRIVATNSAGTSYGDDQTFTTTKGKDMPWLRLLLRKK